MAEERPILRLFVSQPTKGRSDVDVYEERWDALWKVQAAQPDRYVALVESYLSETVEGVNPPLWYLGASLQLMSKADLVFMAPGWTSDRQCLLERLAAKMYDVEVACYEEYADEEEGE